VSRPPRRRRVAVVLAAALTGGALTGGCTAGSSPPSSSVTPTAQRPIDRAVEAVNASGRRIDLAMNRLVVAANGVDADDRAAGGGRWMALLQRSAVDPAVVDQLVSALPATVRAYQGALDRLDAALAPSEISARESAAVRQVLIVGRARADADESFVRSSEVAWPVYAMFAGRQALWFDRASTGWYRSQPEAAAAYAVIAQPIRQAVDRASRVFAAADRARRDATAEFAATLAAVRPLLEGTPRPTPSVP
jgi:hypothetical protein